MLVSPAVPPGAACWGRDRRLLAHKALSSATAVDVFCWLAEYYYKVTSLNSHIIFSQNTHLLQATTSISHLYLSLLPCLVFSFSNASHLHTSVQAKWTGSKIIKYGSDAFRLCTWLSVLEESCPSFRLHLLSLLPQSYSSFLSSAHQSWDATQDNARKWRRDPAVKRRRITKKWGNQGQLIHCQVNNLPP